MLGFNFLPEFFLVVFISVSRLPRKLVFTPVNNTCKDIHNFYPKTYSQLIREGPSLKLECTHPLKLRFKNKTRGQIIQNSFWFQSHLCVLS